MDGTIVRPHSQTTRAQGKPAGRALVEVTAPVRARSTPAVTVRGALLASSWAAVKSLIVVPVPSVQFTGKASQGAARRQDYDSNAVRTILLLHNRLPVVRRGPNLIQLRATTGAVATGTRSSGSSIAASSSAASPRATIRQPSRLLATSALPPFAYRCRTMSTEPSHLELK